ncbi:MAG: pilus assembly protein PilM [Candidatus Omnitrophica bacterium]|nr:pilus assembly protein PilM [Candidatus Omnitrophota bacterium]
MPKKKIGVFFGKSSITIAESQGKDIINYLQVPSSGLKSTETDGKAPEDVRIIAALQEEIRASRLETKEAVLSIPSEDLIIRFFSLPPMPKRELPSSISFEVKKFIPFKVEDLVFDFQARLNKEAKKLDCVFIGIKKDTLEKYVSISTQSGFRILSIEPGFFSVLRLLRPKKDIVNNKQNVAIVDLGVTGEEGNITFLKSGFPEFSRELKLPLQEEGGQSGQEGYAAQLSNEIRISLDYFRRLFPNIAIDRVFFLSRPENKAVVEGLSMDLGLKSSFIDTTELIKSDLPYSIDIVKASGASLRDTIKFEYSIDLFRKQLAASDVEASALALEIKTVPVSRDIILRGFFAFLLAIAGIYFYTNQKLSVLRSDIASIQQKQPGVKIVDPGLPAVTLASEKQKWESKLAELKGMFKQRRYLTTKLSKIADYLGEGAWLSQLTYSYSPGGLIVSGHCYLGEEKSELDSINSFVTRLKTDAEFSQEYKDISIRSITRTELQDTEVTSFEVSCASGGK